MSALCTIEILDNFLLALPQYAHHFALDEGSGGKSYIGIERPESEDNGRPLSTRSRSRDPSLSTDGIVKACYRLGLY